MTEFRPVVGYEGLYEVSDQGDVRSLDRVVHLKNRWGFVAPRQLKGRVLTPCKCSNGYLKVTFESGGKQHLVHRLVAQAFVPGDVSLQVNHRNGNRADNRAENLEWLSCSDNHRHSYQELDRKEHGRSKPIVLFKGDQVLAFPNGGEAARFLGVSSGSITSAVKHNHACKGFEVSYG